MEKDVLNENIMGNNRLLGTGSKSRFSYLVYVAAPLLTEKNE